MVRIDYTGHDVDVTPTDTSDNTHWVVSYWRESKTIKKESKDAKRTRLALEKNRASWIVFNERIPTIKQVFKPVNNFNQRR